MDEKFNEELAGPLTIGRILWYHVPVEERIRGNEFAPGIITAIHPGDKLSLTLFLEGDVSYVTDVVFGEDLGQVTWPKRMAGVSGG